MSESDIRKRLAAILAADVAGYSRLMNSDESGTVAALDRARAVFRASIDANQGRVIDMAGDSVLAIFETASGAVGSALAIQRALDRYYDKHITARAEAKAALFLRDANAGESKLAELLPQRGPVSIRAAGIAPVA